MSYKALTAFGMECPMGQQPNNTATACEEYSPREKELFCNLIKGEYNSADNTCTYTPNSADQACITSGGVISDPLTSGCICPSGTSHRLPPGDCVRNMSFIPEHTGQSAIKGSTVALIAILAAGAGAGFYALLG